MDLLEAEMATPARLDAIVRAHDTGSPTACAECPFHHLPARLTLLSWGPHSLLLHPPYHRGEVLLAATCGFFRIHSRGRLGGRNREAQACRLAQDQSEVLPHEPN